MDEPPPLPSRKPEVTNSIFHHAAIACICSPFFAIGVAFVAFLLQARWGRTVAGMVLAIGFLAGTFALTGIRRHGGKWTLGRALSGMCACVLLAGASWAISNWISDQIGQRQAHSFQVARELHQTRLTKKTQVGEPTPKPPAGIFNLVQYETPIGPMDAYVGVNPGDGKRHPAIIWKFGGFSNSIGEDAWTPGSPDNDQSATQFREAGIVMMYASVRGGNMNPGYVECGFGEVDDLIAAARHLKQLPYVDPDRVYLGGHSVGGTYVLLAAAAAPEEYRAVFSFGPVANTLNYPEEYLTFDTKIDMEASVRAPIVWLHKIKSPTFVFEGGIDGNGGDLHEMESKNPGEAKFFVLKNHDHFSLIQPLTRFLARKILNDTGTRMKMSTAEVETAVF